MSMCAFLLPSVRMKALTFFACCQRGLPWITSQHSTSLTWMKEWESGRVGRGDTHLRPRPSISQTPPTVLLREYMRVDLGFGWAELRRCHEHVAFAQTRLTRLLACAGKQHKPSLTTTSLFVREPARGPPYHNQCLRTEPKLVSIWTH